MNAVEIHGVTKSFRRRTIKGGYTTFKTELLGLFSGRQSRAAVQNIDVLKGIELVIPQGKTVGIIGENGSGKSTLLKILTGIYAPTAGTAVVRGRVSALLELGAGFHPDFSGRENIYVNGVILGLTRTQVREKLEEIIEFSELRDFIDEPVRTYSSGMYMRLAFAVATFVDPDVLIIDEILSVGDEHFARKSRLKMEEFKKKRKTIVLVTHDLNTVNSWCDLAAWIHQGKIAAFGNPNEVIGAYRRHIKDRERQIVPSTPSEPFFSGVFTATRSGAEPSEGDGQPTPESPIEWEWDYRLAQSEMTEGLHFAIEIQRADGLLIYRTDTVADAAALITPLPNQGTLRLQISRLGLLEGDYLVKLEAKSHLSLPKSESLSFFTIRADGRGAGVARPPCDWSVKPI